MDSKEIKKKIKDNIVNKLKLIKNIKSITFVGSFIDKVDMSGISDIDTVIVCDKLNKIIFEKCIRSLENLDMNKCGLNDYTLKINSTFGPLKFDEPNLIIIHLMIYDYELHRIHVCKSPFTCYDWERSQTIYGFSLKNIYPVGSLQYTDFLQVRRSLNNYLEDLNNNSISYREYKFLDGQLKEVRKKFIIDSRHKGEFSYHIIHNLISNYLKLCSQKNKLFSKNEIISEIKRLFLISGDLHSKKYSEIFKIKSKMNIPFPKKTTQWTKNFIQQYQKSIKTEWSDAIKVRFYRHFKTKLNDKTYFGQGRDSGIDYDSLLTKSNNNVDLVYSSPSLRCVETAKILFENSNIIRDNRLLEINYGKCEGKSYEDLKINFPDIIKKWEEKKDPSFPDGESTSDVFNRLDSFLNDLNKLITNNNYKSISVISHNVFLRCLIGHYLNLDRDVWFKLIIPHGEKLEFLYWKNKFYPNISREILGNILLNIGLISK